MEKMRLLLPAAEEASTKKAAWGGLDRTSPGCRPAEIKIAQWTEL